jgi:uncharacterized protein (TIGR03437 family)
MHWRFFVTAALAGILTASFPLSAQVAVVSAASYQSIVASNSLAALFGNGLSIDTATAQLDSSGQLPTTLAGVTVKINGTAAGLLYVSPSQINLLIPANTDTGTAAILVQSSSLATQFSGSVEVRNVAPAIFTLDNTGRGPGAILNAVTFTGAPFLVETPENQGSDKRTRLAVYATGLRYAGNPARDPAIPNAAIQVQARDNLGNVYAVEYAGAAPGFFGLDQINLIVPAAADGVGVLSLTVVAENRASNTVTLQMGSIPDAEVHIAGVTLAQPSVVGGKDISGTILLNGAARGKGLAVNLSTDSLLIQIPQTMTIPAGSASFKFTAHTSVSGTTNVAHITAAASGFAESAKLTVFPVSNFKLTGLTLSPSSVKGGAQATGKVTLSGSPPVGGSTVVLASDTEGVTVPDSVTLPFGHTSATFAISTAAANDPLTAKITAAYSDSTASATLTVNPPLTITLASNAQGGGSLQGTITLFDAAPAGGAAVGLLSTNAALATVPKSVTIPAGKNTASFTVATTAVSAPIGVAIQASLNGVEKAVLLAINPPGLPGVASLKLNSALVNGGTTVAGTVTLSAPAPSNGVTIDLLSDDPLAVQPPPVVTIPSGQTSAGFSVNTAVVSFTKVVTVTAMLGGVSKTATLTVQ